MYIHTQAWRWTDGRYGLVGMYLVSDYGTELFYHGTLSANGTCSPSSSAWLQLDSGKYRGAIIRSCQGIRNHNCLPPSCAQVLKTTWQYRLATSRRESARRHLHTHPPVHSGQCLPSSNNTLHEPLGSTHGRLKPRHNIWRDHEGTSPVQNLTTPLAGEKKKKIHVKLPVDMDEAEAPPVLRMIVPQPRTQHFSSHEDQPVLENNRLSPSFQHSQIQVHMTSNR